MRPDRASEPCDVARGTMDAVDEELRALVARALDEDAPGGDLTTSLVVSQDAGCRADLVSRAAGVLAGSQAAEAVFQVAAEQDGHGIEIGWRRRDGDEVGSGELLALIEGPARTILRAERVALNFLGRLSGVATLTRAFTRAAGPARILCTRKTTPGLRSLERQAVVAGGGDLHRASLSEAILVKDNHVRLVWGVGEAVHRAKRSGRPVEVEAETAEEVEQALAAGADRILLDNPVPDLVRWAAERVEDPGRLEVSGGVTLSSVRDLVDAGARLISVGRLTHSAPALDVALDVRNVIER